MTMTIAADMTPQLDQYQILEEAIAQTKYLAQEGCDFQSDDNFLCPLDFVSFLYPELAPRAQQVLNELRSQYCPNTLYNLSEMAPV